MVTIFVCCIFFLVSCLALLFALYGIVFFMDDIFIILLCLLLCVQIVCVLWCIILCIVPLRLFALVYVHLVLQN